MYNRPILLRCSKLSVWIHRRVFQIQQTIIVNFNSTAAILACELQNTGKVFGKTAVAHDKR